MGRHRVERPAPRSSDDEDENEDDDEEGDEDSSDSDDEEMLEWMEQEEAGLYPETDELDVFPSVPYVYPRMNYRGAKNVHTVKDVTFLGVRSDKVCSGSDDGNWFVWDKMTGKLEGIWKGDGQVVNVVEQHPSLPLVACSGIDSTVKIFAPQPIPRNPSHRRIDEAEAIIKRNTEDMPDRMPSMFGRAAFLNHYLRLLAESDAEITLEGAGEEDGPRECRVQ